MEFTDLPGARLSIRDFAPDYHQVKSIGPTLATVPVRSHGIILTYEIDRVTLTFATVVRAIILHCSADPS